MKMKFQIMVRLVLVGFCASAVSCVIGQREVDLKIPQGTRAAAKGTASINRVSDSRAFQNKPEDPSIPSVDGDVGALTAQQRETFIGRQRNTYGKGMGDVVLPSGQSVSAKARELVTEALARRGYSVGASGVPVTVDVKQFWGWMTPGMWAISLEARIEASISARGKSFQVLGYGKNLCQAATTGNWDEAYQRAMTDFLSKLDSQLSAAGL